MAGASVGLDSPFRVNGTSTEQDLLDVIHLHYAWVLFVVFIAAFVTNVILAAEPSSEAKGPVLLGPGENHCRPLLQGRTRKSVNEERSLRISVVAESYSSCISLLDFLRHLWSMLSTLSFMLSARARMVGGVVKPLL
jgi:hypothetical protein